MSQREDRKGILKRLASLIGLLVSISALTAIQAPPALLAIISIAWLVLYFRLQKGSSEYTSASPLDRAITLALVLVGYIVGRFIPIDSLIFFPEGLGLALLIFLGGGLIELPVLNRILSPDSAVSLLNRHRFPFISLGLALSIVLHSHG